MESGVDVGNHNRSPHADGHRPHSPNLAKDLYQRFPGTQPYVPFGKSDGVVQNSNPDENFVEEPILTEKRTKKEKGVSANEAADILGVKTSEIYDMVEEGKLKGYVQNDQTYILIKSIIIIIPFHGQSHHEAR